MVANADTGVDWTHPALKDQYRPTVTIGVGRHEYNWWDAVHSTETSTCSANHAVHIVLLRTTTTTTTTSTTQSRTPITDGEWYHVSQEPCDDHGHGTHTTGTAVGDDMMGNQIGVAPKANWIGTCRPCKQIISRISCIHPSILTLYNYHCYSYWPYECERVLLGWCTACRNMDAGTGSPQMYIECLQFFVAPTNSDGQYPRSELRPHSMLRAIPLTIHVLNE